MGKDVKELLKTIVGVNPNLPLTAKVIGVNDKTVSIELANGLQLSDVRLTATGTDDKEGLIIEPKIGSDILVMSQTGKLSELFVIKVNDINSIRYVNGDFKVEIDANQKKVGVKNATGNLGALTAQLIDEIVNLNIVVSTPAGPGTGSVNTAQQTILNQVKTGFNSILKND